MLVSSGRVDTFLKRPKGGFLGIGIRILVQTLRPLRVICELDHGDTELVVKSSVGHREPKNDMLSLHYRVLVTVLVMAGCEQRVNQFQTWGATRDVVH